VFCNDKKHIFTDPKKIQMTHLVGRNREQRLLINAYQSPESEMVAVLGRRRVGKTSFSLNKHSLLLILSLQAY
jgi:hypothetical protein